MSPVESLLAYLVARRHPGCRGQAEDTGRRQKKPGQELRNSQGNQLQLAARTVTETETEICQTARTIKTGPRAVDLISALPLIPLFLLLYPNVFIFLLFFFRLFAADFVTAENATHARFYGSALSPFRFLFSVFFFGSKGKHVHCTCHKAAQQSSSPTGH